jgi:hypothetical protein
VHSTFKNDEIFEVFTAVDIHVDVFCVVTPCRSQKGDLKCWYPTTKLHGVTTQKTST